MSEIEFSCISCRSSLSGSKSDVGELVQCPHCNHTMKVPRYGIVSGMKLGDFKILKCLGVGGMGEVWLAEQESLQRRVALKILSPDISNDESFVNRFNQEVKIAGKLIHPNIVVAFQAGEQNGIRYLTSAYVDGLVASEAVEINGPLEESEVIRIGRDIAKALKYAWEKAHILHRDVKPDNIMLANDGTVMLMDMGISKNFDEDVSLTMTGEIIGTPNYISPEQAHAADKIDFRSDQYSLGATLFHLLTGLLPYRATSAMGILAQHLQNPVPDAREYKPEVSKGCSKMIQKMMSKKPEDRYQSWDEFIVHSNSLLPPEMRDGTILPGTLKAHTTGNKKNIIIGLAAAVTILAISITLFLIGDNLNNDKQNNNKIDSKPQLENPLNIKKANTKKEKNELIQQKDVKKLNIDPEETLQSSIKRRITKQMQQKFEINESQAEKIAEKLLIYHSKRRELGRTKDTDTKKEHLEKWKKILEPAMKDLFDTAKEILGETKFAEFKNFVRNDLRKPPVHLGRRRNRFK